jgi:hypothetical protein
VYVAEEGSEQAFAFRNGDQWFFANGNAANDGSVIFGGGVVTPAYVNPEENIKSDDFNVDGSFEDYEAQVNWMPRMAFSFPISDEANFFAHYDILVQRPFPIPWLRHWIISILKIVPVVLIIHLTILTSDQNVQLITR